MEVFKAHSPVSFVLLEESEISRRSLSTARSSLAVFQRCLMKEGLAVHTGPVAPILLQREQLPLNYHVTTAMLLCKVGGPGWIACSLWQSFPASLLFFSRITCMLFIKGRLYP